IERNRRAGVEFLFAVTRAMDGAFIGMCGAERLEADLWEFGYWYGKSYRRQGYATEAARAVMRFAFDELGAVMLTAGWFVDNPESGRVLAILRFVRTAPMHSVCVT